VRRLKDMVEFGARIVCLLALSDSGVPACDQNRAGKIAEFGVPCFGCTPNKLPELIGGALKKQDLKALAARRATKKQQHLASWDRCGRRRRLRVPGKNHLRLY
jgi:hypothetical protein